MSDEQQLNNQAMFNALEAQAEQLRTDHCWHYHRIQLRGHGLPDPVQFYYRDTEICCFCGLIYDKSDESKMQLSPGHGSHAGLYVPRPSGCDARLDQALKPTPIGEYTGLPHDHPIIRDPAAKAFHDNVVERVNIENVISSLERHS